MRSANARAALDHADQQRDDLRSAHEFSMAAKECIFVAQDAAARIVPPSPATGRTPSHGRRRLQSLAARLDRDLARVRSILEQLDNAVEEHRCRENDAMQKGERP